MIIVLMEREKKNLERRSMVSSLREARKSSQLKEMPGFGLTLPKTQIKDVPLSILRPQDAWESNGKTAAEFKEKANMLAGLFQKNFTEYADRCSEAVRNAGPKKQ